MEGGKLEEATFVDRLPQMLKAHQNFGLGGEILPHVFLRLLNSIALWTSKPLPPFPLLDTPTFWWGLLGGGCVNVCRGGITA